MTREPPSRATDKFDDDDYPAYTMGRAAEMIRTTPAFLRAVGEARLIVTLRSEGGHRRYSRYQLPIAACARELVDQGPRSMPPAASSSSNWGAMIAREWGRLHSGQVAGVHVTTLLSATATAKPTEQEAAGLTQAETDRMRASAARRTYNQCEEMGYGILQSTRLQTLGFALTDSPGGQLAWIIEKLKAFSASTYASKDVLAELSPVCVAAETKPSLGLDGFGEPTSSATPLGFEFLLEPRHLPLVVLQRRLRFVKLTLLFLHLLGSGCFWCSSASSSPSRTDPSSRSRATTRWASSPMCCVLTARTGRALPNHGRTLLWRAPAGRSGSPARRTSALAMGLEVSPSR